MNSKWVFLLGWPMSHSLTYFICSCIFCFMKKFHYSINFLIFLTVAFLSVWGLWWALSGNIYVYCILQHSVGEGNGNPLLYSCLENPMDGGAWKAAVRGVAEGQAWLSDFTFTFHFHALEKETGNLLQCSCLETPRDSGAWWAAVCGVAQSQTRLKRLSSSSIV